MTYAVGMAATPALQRALGMSGDTGVAVMGYKSF